MVGARRHLGQMRHGQYLTVHTQLLHETADSFGHSGFAIDGTDWVADYSASEKDVLLFTGAGATRDQFGVEFGSIDGQGSAGVAEAFIVHIPSGRTIWAITDGAAMSDIFLKLGATSYDLI